MSLHPAGLSSDSIDLSLTASTHPPSLPFDQWSDAHGTMETDDERDEQDIQEASHPEDMPLGADKVATGNKTIEVGTPSSTTGGPQMNGHTSDGDAASVHSMPVVQVTEPSSPVPTSAQSASSRFPPSPSTSLAPSPSMQHGRNRNRTALEVRASNRLSGFFSSLIHRREPVLSATPEGRTPKSPLTNTSSRASSPAPSRPSTPPPRLPPPSLHDLGLTLSSLTAHISPSHANGPPASGAFLRPHYLLLCHAQGLDVLSLVSPPALQPYALIRRVAFKSVVVMEHRGVLVAIAGRRNGVRVYALEDIKRAVEWRIEVEVRREQDRARREEAKRSVGNPVTTVQLRAERGSSVEKLREKLPLTAVATGAKEKLPRRSSLSGVSPGIPRTPTVRRPKTAEGAQLPPPAPTPVGPPPSYSSTTAPPRGLDHSTISVAPSRSRATSLNDVLSGTMSRRQTGEFHLEQESHREDDMKADWASSDDEAINVVAAPSGSQLLDERTSTMVADPSPGPSPEPGVHMSRSQTAPSLHRRSRPANLDLSLTRSNSRTTATSGPPPSPTPTLLTLRQALSISPQNNRNMPAMGSLTGAGAPSAEGDADGDADEEDDGDADPSSPTTPTRERISLADALMESRLPDIPPAGSRLLQDPILIGTTTDEVPSSPRTSESGITYTRRSTGDQSQRRRRRWSVLDGIFSHSPSNSASSITPLQEDRALESVASPLGHGTSETGGQPSLSELSRSQTTRITPSNSSGTIRPETSRRPSTSTGVPAGTGSQSVRDRAATVGNAPSVPSLASTVPTGSRFLPRIITNAFQARRSDDLPPLPRLGDIDAKKSSMMLPPPPPPAPKLEYAKLPGTKGAVLIKAVETAKKSFLAILCGDTGEKVELFAGTYRTALQLSRTFILPDSPRSLELQLQGDDLVEVFLVFTQNVFGLEPATVRVREVRIGRAERRAARRRARETRPEQSGDADGEGAGADDDIPVNVTVLTSSSPPPVGEDGPSNSSASSSLAPGQSVDATQPQGDASSLTGNSTEELLAVTAAQSSPYTTFQQLSFAPNFPLAAIADEYIIPPTYASFLEYRSSYEPEVNGDTNVDLSQVQFSPPGLPVPVPAPPSMWYYRDPKGNVHGPWKAAIMQAWYRDSLLPPDLPVKREEDSEYMVLKDLRAQCVDPTHPFRSAPPLPTPTPPIPAPDDYKPLLSPISLLSQPRHFGPPALFYSSRGGHSTTIVDARGRSVLKGRITWSADNEDSLLTTGRLGDVKRLEAFDVDDRAVLVAMRQGGLEVVDFGDALLRPADHSRTVYPHFQPPYSSVSRRGAFVWKIGTPLTSHSSMSSLHSVVDIPTSKSVSHRKKLSTGPAKSPRSDFTLSSDGDSDRMQDEVLFLGRKDNEIYICERRVGSFRILKLSPRDTST